MFVSLKAMNLEDDDDDTAWTVESEDLEHAERDNSGEEDDADAWLTVGTAGKHHSQINSCILSTEIKHHESYASLGAILPVPSQTLTVSMGQFKFDIDLDSGATVSFLRLDVAKRLQLQLLPNAQLALLADKVSQMKSLGEVNIELIEISL